MQKGTTLFQLRADYNGVFDGSNAGVAIQRAANVKALAGDAGIMLAAGVVEVARNANLDDLQAFTIEATITPARIGPNRQNILEAQSPGIAFFLGPEGKLLGSLFVNGVWTAVDSGTAVIAAGRDTRVGFTRDETGKAELTIDGRVVASKAIPGAIGKAGEAGLRIGAGADSRAYQFNGVMGDLTIRQGAVTQDFLAARQQRAQTITASLATILPRVRVSLVPDESRARLQPIKDIMNAAGVQRLSDLQTLRITTRTVMSSGTVMVAARTQTTPSVNWAAVATQFRAAAPAERKTLLASVLANQNSQPLLAQAAALPPAAAALSTPVRSVIPSASPIAPAPPAAVVPTPAALTGVLARTALRTQPLTELVRLENRVLRADPTVLQQIVDRNPANWPITTQEAFQVRSLTTIPVSSAVIIAGTLDLTDTQLVVEPNVKTLYIIAERVICGNNASITWRRPGGVVPARG